MSDTKEGRTLFLRNLSFDVDDDTLFAFFVSFAPLEFAKVVRDPETRHSRGTGFVKFCYAEDASRVLSESAVPENALRFTLENRTLHLSMAVPRDEAAKLRTFKHDDLSSEDASHGKPLSMAERLRRGGRNLHLASIGMIRAGTAAAEGLSESDLAKRVALMRAKKAKLSNPNIFISDVRLCVRNLPLSVSDQRLKQACLDLLGPHSKHRITECRVMRNLEPGRQQLRSLGYAFVSFTCHEDALKVLHGLNNNPNIFPNQRRPIVEFSLENMQALEIKRRRIEKCAAIQMKRKNASSESNSTPFVNPTTPRNRGIGRPEAKPNRKSISRNVKMQHRSRVLPKRFGPKHRHRNRLGQRGKAKPGTNKLPKAKGRMSRSQKRTKKNL
ncbi:unnamed protein product [Dicrocoelium dendriticum]|nr:unnamed protein product [Dicrocoelium dendriticum]